MRQTISKLSAGAALLAVLGLGAAGCASTPVPNEKIAVAKASVERAEQAGAVEYAPVEMQAARDKLTRAERANSDHDRVPAADLADQANADARLAEATAQEHKSHKAATELDASLQSLRQESNRNTTQPAQ
jgi:Domain of unknown function (DUF4398)